MARTQVLDARWVLNPDVHRGASGYALDFDAAVKAGSMNGIRCHDLRRRRRRRAGVLKWTQFYEHESCGKCTPCREGNYWTAQILERIWHGEGTAEDLDSLLDICDNILGRSFCALGDGATSPISSSLKYFRSEYEALIPELNGARN